MLKNRQNENIPEKLLARAEQLTQEGKTEEAQQLTDKAQKNKQHIEEYISKMQTTLFPIDYDEQGQKFELADMIREASIDEMTKLEKRTFYHGTTAKVAEVIRQKGFRSDLPSDRILETGMGTYLTTDLAKAKGYAHLKEEGVLQCNIKNLRKVAVIKDSTSYSYLTSTLFFKMMQFYMNQHRNQIDQEYRAKGLLAEKSFEYNFILGRHLRNEFTKLFFTKMGYEAVYVPYSNVAGCEYVNVFDPANIEITK